MNRENLIIAHCKEWADEIFKIATHLFDDTKFQLYFVRNKNELINTCNKLPSGRIFFVHWSWIIKQNILKNFECICFHMTDLPYGRGGSPLQNLILRGHTKTKISAIKMTNIIDGGPIYLKRDLRLDGSAYEIFLRASKICVVMAFDIINLDIMPDDQVGEITSFKRLSIDDNRIDFKNLDINKIYDIIRMLDAPGYPSAWIEIDKYRIEFLNAKKANGKIEGNYKIHRKQ